MRKISVLFISLALLAVLAVNVSAADLNIVCDASAASVKKGEQVVFTFRVSGAGAAKSALIETSFGSAFEVVSGEWLKSGALMADFNGEDGVIAFAGETDFNGDLFRLTLKAKEETDSVQNVTAAISLKNGSADAGSGSATKSVTLAASSSAGGSNTGGAASGTTSASGSTSSAQATGGSTAQTQTKGTTPVGKSPKTGDSGWRILLLAAAVGVGVGGTAATRRNGSAANYRRKNKNAAERRTAS